MKNYIKKVISLKINVVVSVDWEGRDLDKANEEAFTAFEKNITFQCSNFLIRILTKGVWSKEEIIAFHKNTLRDVDELVFTFIPGRN